MKIGLDIMGGDYAPETTVAGAVLARQKLPGDVRLVLFGDTERILPLLQKNNASPGQFEIVHTTQVIEMGDHPMKAFTKKTDSSIAVGFEMLKRGKIDSFTGNGNTGAMMVAALYSVKAIEGVLRPSLAGVVPKEDGGTGLLLDVGSNADCRPEVLCQFAQLGQIYAKAIFHIENPKVGLLNIGEEEEKGNLIAQSTHQMMKKMTTINFVGNIEGRDLFSSKADVVVCEGFVGNVVLKEAEALYELMKKRNRSDDYFERFNYENYGGVPLLGINSPIIAGHGISSATATCNMLIQAYHMVETRVTEKIKMAFNPSLAESTGK
ncbi:MAG: phosphate acyltransferase PlsX [Bacteroidia bacterium]|nr:phosphate acyltransferase PlsX [Bacteroidia bacterium]